VIHFIKTIHFQDDRSAIHISSIEISCLFVFKESKGNAMAHLTASRALPQAGRSATSARFLPASAAAFAVWRQRRALAEPCPTTCAEDVGLTEAEIDFAKRAARCGTFRTTGGSERAVAPA
jgi:hypothetical protein